MAKRALRKRVPKVGYYDIRVCLKSEDAMKVKQVIFQDERGMSWSAEIINVHLVREKRQAKYRRSGMSLTPESRQALGEYIIRQKRKGRTELPSEEIVIAVRAIQAAIGEPELPDRDHED